MSKKVLGVNGNASSFIRGSGSGTFDFGTDSTDIFNQSTIKNDNKTYVIKGLEEPILNLDQPIKKNMFMSYDNIDGKTSASDLVDKLNISSNYISGSPKSIFNKNLNYYNRFKIKSSDDVLTKAFPHVFFVRPDLNLFRNNNEDITQLSKSIEANPFFSFVWKNDPDLVRSLILNSNSRHQFNMYLSNKVTSFETSDEYIGIENNGKTFLGHQITYGKDSIESKTASELNLKFDDDKFCHTYILNKLWMEYINLVSRGSIAPNPRNILDKVLDYTSAIYYIVTAEDGETIIFWSKYYGVFPSAAPSSQFSWDGEMIQGPMSYSLKYQYSFKEDFNPATLLEFNKNSGITLKSGAHGYIDIYDPQNCTVGSTWVGKPYIEINTDMNTPNSGIPYGFKLRFTNR